MSVRGYTSATIDGRDYQFLLTVGAQAEIEEKLGLETINSLMPLLGRLNAKAVLVTARALARGAGTPPADIDHIDKLLVADLLAPVTSAVVSAYEKPAGAEDDAAAEKKP